MTAAAVLLGDVLGQAVGNVVLFLLAAATGAIGYKPILQLIRWEEAQAEDILHRKLLMEIQPRTVTLLIVAGIVALTVLGYILTRSELGAVIGMGGGIAAPVLILRYLRRRRLARLDAQLVGGVQTLASGVRAGLNLVQSMQLVARDGPAPLREEVAHLLREYEYGVPLEEAMDNSAGRIGSGDYRLLFAALQTHRERGGDLGDTLDRISESIREIQRLETR
jgi:tight adherence protein B